MKKDYPKFKRGEIEDFFKELPSSEKKILSDYLEYRKARGVESSDKLKDIRRYMLHLRFIIEKNYKQFNNLNDLRSLLAIINTTKNLSDVVKNNLKIDLKNFLKYLFDDWSKRFKEFEDIKIHSRKRNDEKINSKTIFKKDDIEKVMKQEKDMFWKAFFITQYEGALRTKETRLLKWNDIKLNEDGDISEIHIYATKTNKARDVFVKDATFYLKTHKKQQENMKIKTIYVFPQKKNPNLPTSKTTVSDHFRPLFKKSLGEHKWNYLLRHSRGTELYTLAKQNKIARDTAIGIMGHSKDMSDFYTHLDTKEVKEILKKQLYKLEELPVEKKHELEEKISSQQKQIEELKKDRERQNKLMFMLAKEKLNSLKGKEKKDVEKEINFLFGKSNPKS